MYRSMPVVHVELYEGRTRDAKQKIVEGITDVFVKEGIAKEAVTVILVRSKKRITGITVSYYHELGRTIIKKYFAKLSL